MNKLPFATQTDLADCFRLTLPVHSDARGRFVKSFHAPTFAANNLCADFKEDFFSISQKNVLRGFHFVAPPLHGAKLVYVIQGHIVDAIVDLRPSSPTYGVCQSFELDAEWGDALYLPAGVAHGFLCTSDTAIVGYKTEFTHDQNSDKGIHWNSTAVRWPVVAPIVSERDQALPPLDQLSNPFV